MNENKWISVDKRTNKLVIRFRVKGYQKQFFIASGLNDSKRNREIVKLKCDAISTDIALNRFDESLNNYQFITKEKKTLKKNDGTHQLNVYDISKLWQKFVEYKSTQIEETTIRVRYKFITNICKKLPETSLANATEIRDWLINSNCKHTAWSTLVYFDMCCRWAVDSKLIFNNPFEKLKIKQPKSKRESNKAFTLHQRDIIIEAFENDDWYSHYANLVKLLFFTGCRPGEAFALTWEDISKDCRKIYINKSCNKFRLKKGTKNNKNRVFPVSENSKLHKILLSIYPTNPNLKELIFQTKTGCPITTSTFGRFWNKYQEPGYFRLGVVGKLASQKKVPYLNPYATRHTFATWAITQGVSPDKVALWIGDTVETVLKFYCHPDIVNAECPDF